jgi:hypothetical protein
MVTLAEPPAAGAVMAPDGTGPTTFAISKLFLGDTDPDGTPDAQNGWKFYGYNLDGTDDTPTTPGLCKPVDNAPVKNVHVSGNNGINNSFGKNILPVILGLSANAPQTINDSITAGKFTIMLSLTDLGMSASYNPIVTQLFAGGDLGAAPKFDGTDMWPVLPALLADPDAGVAGGSLVQFPMSYTTNNTWVSGGKGTITLMLSVSGFTLNLEISNAVMSMVLDSTHQHVTGGIIAGILPTNALISQLKMVAGAFDPSLCSGPTIDSITSQIAQASDILQDGTQSATQSCDGISIGLGFNAELVQLGPVAPPAMPKADPCADAGM